MKFNATWLAHMRTRLAHADLDTQAARVIDMWRVVCGIPSVYQ